MSFEITVRIASEIISHEAVVREAYRDSRGVWTWSVGITNSSGHRVHPRYKDKPQTLRRCLEVFEWVLRNRYLPAVREVFDGFDLAEHQVGAALSFHYNTGGLRRATWAKRWKAGDTAAACATFMNWSKPPEIVPRREKERDLFFDAAWSSDGSATEYPVRKPSYTPDRDRARMVEIRPVLEEIFGA